MMRPTTLVSCFKRHKFFVNFCYLATFKVDFGQVQPVQAINQSHEHCGEALISMHVHVFKVILRPG